MKPHFPRCGLLAALTALLLAASGAAPAATDAQFQGAFTEFQQASAGDGAAIGRAAEAFGALAKAEPANPVLLAYAGASTTMKARGTFLPWRKMSYAEDGLAQLDKALAQLTPAHDAPLQRGTPGSLEVRFVAASTFLAVPGFMNRGARGEKLLHEVLASPLFAAAPLAFRGSVWMKAAERAAADRQPDEARRWYGEVVRAQAPQSAQAQLRLQALKS
jgi:hypothetical protein